MTIQSEVEALRGEMVALRAEVAELKAHAAASSPASADDTHSTETEHLQSERPHREDAHNSETNEGLPGRRDMFKKAGYVAAGALGGVVLGATKPAAAADPNDLTLSAVNSATGRTDLRYIGPPLNQNILTVQNADFTSTARPAAVAGYATSGTGVKNGMYAWCDTRDNTNSQTGHAMIASGSALSRSNLYLIPGAQNPKFDTYVHTSGEIRMDLFGSLWCCVSSGTPGSWRKLASSNTAGSFHFLNTPVRSYDSRPSQGGPGSLAANETRTVTLADLPARINGVALNVTIVGPAGVGWAKIWAAGGSEPPSSSVNYATGQTVGNNVFSAVNSAGAVSVFTVAQTDIVIDAVGYFE